MKRQKRIITLLLSLAIIFSFATSTLATATQPPDIQGQTQEERKDVLIIRYREYNGYLQMRYWNETKGHWEGQWETIGVAT